MANNARFRWMLGETSTMRSLTTGDKRQKILVIRWEKSSDVEVKCDGGKFVKETTGPELDTIVEMVKAVVQTPLFKTAAMPSNSPCRRNSSRDLSRCSTSLAHPP
ncbi:MAG: hypothetical protein ABI999_08130 [Acidobacteriota bacterium]